MEIVALDLTGLFPFPDATTVAKKLVDEFFCCFSVPDKWHSDQGKQFESHLISSICELLQVKKSRTTPCHPQSDGLVERFNRTLTIMLDTHSNRRATLRRSVLHIIRVCMPPQVTHPSFSCLGDRLSFQWTCCTRPARLRKSHPLSMLLT